jgi:phosphate transport system permease protein
MVRGAGVRRVRERTVEVILLVCGLASILSTIGIVAVLCVENVGFFREVSLRRFLTDREWTPLFADKHFGIAPLLCGTVLTTAIAMMVALPLGLLISVYLCEFAPAGVRRVLKPLLEVLAGIPTVVYGYFALLFVTPLLQRLVPSLMGFNALAPGLVMGMMILPLVASLSEDALFAVPQSLREAAYGLGATRLQMVFKTLIPSALSGITASFILGMSRAVGETMIVAIAAGQQPVLTLNPLVPIETMTAYIVQVSLGDTPHGTLEYHTIFAVGMALFVTTLFLNMVSLALRERYRRVYA